MKERIEELLTTNYNNFDKEELLSEIELLRNEIISYGYIPFTENERYDIQRYGDIDNIRIELLNEVLRDAKILSKPIEDKKWYKISNEASTLCDNLSYLHSRLQVFIDGFSSSESKRDSYIFGGHGNRLAKEQRIMLNGMKINKEDEELQIVCDGLIKRFGDRCSDKGDIKITKYGNNIGFSYVDRDMNYNRYINLVNIYKTKEDDKNDFILCLDYSYKKILSLEDEDRQTGYINVPNGYVYGSGFNSLVKNLEEIYCKYSNSYVEEKIKERE